MIFKYNAKLSRSVIDRNDIVGKFNDIETAVNTKKFDSDQFRFASVRRRHFSVPPRIFLWDERVGNAIFSGSLNKAGNWNWTNVNVEFTASVSNLDGRPLGMIQASYLSHDWERGAYEICIGYSTDGGMTYNPVPKTSRFLGYTNAHTNPPWLGKTTEPITGLANSWWPYSMYGKREARTHHGIMNISGVDPTQVTHWGVGIRVNEPIYSTRMGTKDVHELDVCRIWIKTRNK